VTLVALLVLQVSVEFWPLSIAAGDADKVMVGAGTGAGGGASVFGTAGGGATFFAQLLPTKTTAIKHNVNKHNMP
jgi:hypothetical protein